MSSFTPEEKRYFYGDENGRGGYWEDEVDDPYDIGVCQNCDATLSMEAAKRGKLYCGERCQQIAETVRYGRKALRDGRYTRDPLVREAIKTRIAQILGGGYNRSARALSRAQKEAIFARDQRTCRLCGAPATEIDHIASASSAPENLQALCHACHQKKTEAGYRKATPEEAVVAEEIWDRIRARKPSQPCDDDEEWDELWKEIAAKQREWARWWG